MQSGNGHESEIVFSAKQLSEILNLTPRRIQQLAEEGIMVKASRGKYKAIDSIQRYIQLLQEKKGDSDEVDYFTERALHEKAKREKAELALAVMKGDLHRSKDVEMVMNDMIAAFRARILAIPTKLAPQMQGLKELAAIRDLLTREMIEALTELSEYDPQVFYAKSEDYVELNDDEDRD
ncbi:hypothetical protein [Brevibacillus sp. H7]|uniref:hypothetical protein n=1 Tax=Brevibacillus sp. H7 TaxID=3349138 RepID=UPI0037FAB195